MGQAYRTDYTLLFIVVNRTTGNGTTQGLRNRSKKDKNLMKRYILFIMVSVFSLALSAQNVKVTGKVTSASDKESLIGVTVKVKGGQTGAITDYDGNYTINAAKNATLVFSMIGFAMKEVAVDGQTTINVTLEDKGSDLNEVVVIGYGAVKKSDLTSSISTVKGAQITEVTTGNAMDALQGKVNGVQIVSAGGPGSQPKVLIRGVTTVNGSDPLYVVDGMPVGTSINFLNNNDIESMEVLKDASAAAIYGTRGSNGVILITTKKGSAGKTRFNFNSSVGFQTLSKPKMAGAGEYEQVFKARYANEGKAPVWNSPKEGYTDAEGTDWWKEVVNSTALVQNYQLGVSGGNDKLVYSLSAGYFRNNSQYKVGYWDKINIRLNTEYTFSKYVKFGIDLAPRTESWDDTPNQLNSCMTMDPTTPVFRPESEWTDNVYDRYQRSYNNQTWNPVASVNRPVGHSRQYGMLMTSFLQVTPISGLTFRTQFGANARFQLSDNYTPLFKIDALEKTEASQISRSSEQWVDWNWTNTLNYITTIAKKHNLNVMAGFTSERFADYTVSASREGVPSDIETLREVSAGTTAQKAYGNTSFNTLVSYLGRIMYNYDGRYYLTATMRADGSSKFTKGNKWATFPSVSAAWRVTGEEFMKDQSVVDNLKLRVGWGRVGNQNISNSSTLTLMGTADYVFGGNRAIGTTVSSVGNNKLKWETVEDYDIGIDMAFLRNRLAITADYFIKKSHDMLYNKQNIYALGYPNWNSEVTMNIGEMKATGWELSINWQDKVSELDYNVGVNLSSVKNKAVKLSGDGPIYTGGFNGDQIIRNEDGGEISRFYGYVADGIFQNWTEVYAHTDEHGRIIQPNTKPGDIRFLDLNHDGKLSADDKKYIGNPYPDLMLGFNFGLNYKNWDVSANFYGTFGNDIFNTTKARYSGQNGENVYAGTLQKAWNGEGTSTDIPRLTYSDLNQNYSRVSSFYVEDGSYFRCKMLQVGYTFPKKMLGDVNLRLFLSAQNLFTITGYSGLDPERAAYSSSVIEKGIDNAGYPNPRTFLFGIDLKF